jgi:hypothetical protein
MSDNRASQQKENRRGFLREALGSGLWLGLGGAVGSRAASATSPKAAVAAASAAARPPGGLGSTLGPDFSYNLSALKNIDPKWIQFDPAGVVATGFRDLRGLCCAGDAQIYAAGDQALRVFDPLGARTQEVALDAAPRCVAVGEDRRVYVGFKDRVQVLEPGSARPIDWPVPSPKALLTSIAVASEHVFVADAGSRVVHRYDRQGKVTLTLCKKDPARGVRGLVVPSPYLDIGIGPEGLLWVVNPGQHQLEAYTLDGQFELAWGETSNGLAGFCGCCNPVHFARLPDGRFVTSEKGLTRVKVYSAKGQFESVVAGPAQFPGLQDNPNATQIGLDVAADAAGRVLVADPTAGVIRLFAARKASS